jgi:hypothetical protein
MMLHHESPEVNGRPATLQLPLDRHAAFERLRGDPALADKSDAAVQLILELLTPDAESTPPREPSRRRPPQQKQKPPSSAHVA